MDEPREIFDGLNKAIAVADQRMTSLVIAEVTGKKHAHVMRDIQNLLAQGVSQSNFGLSSYTQDQPNGGTKQVPMYSLTPKGVLILASGYNPVLREKIINRLEEWETGQRTPTVPQQPVTPQPTLTDIIKTAKFLASFLRLNDTSKLALAKAIADPLGLPTPEYAKSKGVMHSATELLQRLGYKVTATAFNKLAAAKGFVSQMSRPGSKGNTHTWYAITDKGKTFGENVVSPKNAKQTQAHWYDDKFDELCALVGIRKEVAA